MPEGDTMNDRERFLACMNYQPVDRVPQWELWYWRETIERWEDEGLPADAHLERYFDVDRRDGVGVSVGLVPGFREETLEETDEYRIYRDRNGVTRQEFKTKGDLTMPKWLRFPMETREDWETLIKPRLNPESPVRYPLRWEEMKRLWAQRDYPLSISAGSIYGWIRNWMGFERVSVTLYDDPDWIQEMMDYVADFVVAVITPALEQVDIDYALMWEDMAYKTGPHLSPAMFRRFMLKPYRKITSCLRDHGVDLIFLDCDGNPEDLVPLWLEAGVNGLYPLERAASVDPVEWRRKFGRELRLIGGVDKRAMAAGKDAIDAELAHLTPLLYDGGYIPWCDHLVPPDVPFQNYLYYVYRMKEATEAAGTL